MPALFSTLTLACGLPPVIRSLRCCSKIQGIDECNDRISVNSGVRGISDGGDKIAVSLKMTKERLFITEYREGEVRVSYEWNEPSEHKTGATSSNCAEEGSTIREADGRCGQRDPYQIATSPARHKGPPHVRRSRTSKGDYQGLATPTPSLILCYYTREIRRRDEDAGMSVL